MAVVLAYARIFLLLISDSLSLKAGDGLFTRACNRGNGF